MRKAVWRSIRKICCNMADNFCWKFISCLMAKLEKLGGWIYVKNFFRWPRPPEKKNENGEINEHQIYSRTISFSKIFKWSIFVFQIAFFHRLSLFLYFVPSFCGQRTRVNFLACFSFFTGKFSSVQLSFFLFSGEIFLETVCKLVAWGEFLDFLCGSYAQFEKTI